MFLEVPGYGFFKLRIGGVPLKVRLAERGNHVRIQSR
jgi:hypothetical protein